MSSLIFGVLLACQSDESDWFFEWQKQNSKPSDYTPEEITWYKDVQPIVEQHCVRCHQSIGPGTGNFRQFETVEVLAELMLDSIDAGTMPPPASSPACRDYEGSDILYMNPASRDVIAAWIEGGKQEGDPVDAREYGSYTYELENPNLELMMTEEYQATFTDSANAGNEYRCFALEHGQTEPFYITAMHPIIGNAEMTHHVIIGKAAGDDLLNGSLGAQGADCLDGTDFATDGAMLGGWAPGMLPTRLPEGVGIRVDPDEYLIIQLHYYQGSLGPTETVDRAGISMEIVSEVEQSVEMMILGDTEFTIPAGEEQYSLNGSYSVEWGARLWSVMPHMHALGSGFSLTANRSGQETCLLDSNGYDFENQQAYLFTEPFDAWPGSEISWECRWNNSTTNMDLVTNPPIDVGYGEGSQDEMCFFFALYSF